MKKVFRLMQAVLVKSTSQDASISIVLADQTTGFYATPSDVMSDAVVVFSRFGFTPYSTVDLYLMTTLSKCLGILSTSAIDEFPEPLILPDEQTGPYQIKVSPNDVRKTK